MNISDEQRLELLVMVDDKIVQLISDIQRGYATISYEDDEGKPRQRIDEWYVTKLRLFRDLKTILNS